MRPHMLHIGLFGSDGKWPSYEILTTNEMLLTSLRPIRYVQARIMLKFHDREMIVTLLTCKTQIHQFFGFIECSGHIILPTTYKFLLSAKNTLSTP